MRVDVSPDLLTRLDRPGPRYTSYPTVPAWTSDFGADQWLVALDAMADAPDRETSLYVHLPYCVKRCHYCGCNAAVPDSRSDVDRYLDHLERELDLVLARIGRGGAWARCTGAAARPTIRPRRRSGAPGSCRRPLRA